MMNTQQKKDLENFVITPIVINFGRHKGKAMRDLVNLDPKYCEWLIVQPQFKEKNEMLFHYMIENGITYDKDFEKKKKERNKRKAEYFLFGKYKSEKIVDVYKNDKSYCNYIATLDNVIKYHKETVETIHELQIQTGQTISSTGPSTVPTEQLKTEQLKTESFGNSQR